MCGLFAFIRRFTTGVYAHEFVLNLLLFLTQTNLYCMAFCEIYISPHILDANIKCNIKHIL